MALDAVSGSSILTAQAAVAARSAVARTEGATSAREVLASARAQVLERASAQASAAATPFTQNLPDPPTGGSGAQAEALAQALAANQRAANTPNADSVANTSTVALFGPPYTIYSSTNGVYYAVSGTPSVSSLGFGSPQEQIAKAQRIQAEALASPPPPTPAERGIAARAAQLERVARTEAAQQAQERVAQELQASQDAGSRAVREYNAVSPTSQTANAERRLIGIYA
jgi:hypothetical protein